MEKRIRITESALRKFLNESFKGILFEDKRVNQARNRSKQVIQNFFSGEQVDVDGILQQFEDVFYHDPQMRARGVMRLEPLFCRLALESGFGQENPDNQKLNRLQQLMGFMHKLDVAKKANLSKVSLDATYEMLENEFGDELDKEKQAEADRINNTEYTANNDYEIIGPVDYETAHEYGNQSCPGSKLCYTQSENTWKQYTDGGYNNVYILLRKGWENVKPVHDDETESPYDAYGLSMIYVFVDEQGNIAYCNTRWNHRANYPQGVGGCDHAMNKEQISRLIGRRFDDIFKPGKNRFRDVARRLQNGEDPSDVFDEVYPSNNGFRIVELKKKWNIINANNELLFDQWFDDISNFENNFAMVYINTAGWNYINKNGEILSPGQWFSDTNSFHDGFGKIHIDYKGYNYIDGNGKYLSQQWFDDAYNFLEGFALIELDGKYNYITQNGKYLSQQWFDDGGCFYRNLAKVKLNGESLCIDKNGKLSTFTDYVIEHLQNGEDPNELFDEIWIPQEGYSVVKLAGDFNFINRKCELLSPQQWFDGAVHFKEGFARIYINGKGCNFIDRNGKYLLQEWVDSANNFCEGFAIIEDYDVGYNYIDQTGAYLSKQWFEIAYSFRNGFARVNLTNGREMYIDHNGNLLDEKPHQGIKYFI